MEELTAKQKAEVDQYTEKRKKNYHLVQYLNRKGHIFLQKLKN